MYIYTPLCRYWIALYSHVLVFIVPYVDIELEDNKQFISNITSYDVRPANIQIHVAWSLTRISSGRRFG